MKKIDGSPGRDAISVFQHAQIKTAGAYISFGGLYLFAVGANLYNGSIPIIRLGGHIMGDETGWECARREVKEEAAVAIEPVNAARTCFVSGENPETELAEGDWDPKIEPGPRPLLVVAHHPKNETVLSLMYLARTIQQPVPSSEVKGLLLLDAKNIARICQFPTTLGQYLDRGGRAIINEEYDRSRLLEPFLQLRILSRLLKAGWL